MEQGLQLAVPLLQPMELLQVHLQVIPMLTGLLPVCHPLLVLNQYRHLLLVVIPVLREGLMQFSPVQIIQPLNMEASLLGLLIQPGIKMLL